MNRSLSLISTVTLVLGANTGCFSDSQMIVVPMADGDEGGTTDGEEVPMAGSTGSLSMGSMGSIDSEGSEGSEGSGTTDGGPGEGSGDTEGGTTTTGEQPDCDGVAGGESVRDACGVCNGDDSSCADCDGEPNGDAQPDECGVCRGPGGPCWGCTTTSASNFDPLATIDDGTCACDVDGAVGIADQSNLASNAGAGGSTQWQSFTVGLSGGLTRIDLGVGSPLSGQSSPGTLEFYVGEGIAGLQLGSQAITLEPVFNTLQQFVLDSPVPMTSGEVYTYRLTVPDTNVGFVDLNTTDVYAGGHASSGMDVDLVFRTQVAQCVPL